MQTKIELRENLLKMYPNKIVLELNFNDVTKLLNIFQLQPKFTSTRFLNLGK
jgi:hypothetical protein